MEPSDSPAGARRRVRLAVRRARESKSLTQTEVADAMEWSLSKVMRIESGEVTVSQNDLRPLLSYLGIRDRSEVDLLIAAAKLSKQRKQWWDLSPYRENITPAMRQLIQLEAVASSIRYFHCLLIPGRLQTPDYARAVFDTWSGEIDENQVKVRLEVRRRRHEEFTSRTDEQKIYTLLDESVLYRQLGNDQVRARQFSTLVDLIDADRLVVRVFTFASKAPIHWIGAFELLYLGAETEENGVMYRESDLIDEIVDDPEKLRRLRDVFERLWHAVPDEQLSRKLIADQAYSLNHQ